MHKTDALILCKNYQNSFIPKLNLHKYTGLNRKLKSSMATMAHCAFHDRVSVELQQFAGARVIEAREEWASKTCPNCRNIKQFISGVPKTYYCSECLFKFDRDFDAVRSIILEYLPSIQSSGGTSSPPTPGPSPCALACIASPSWIISLHRLNIFVDASGSPGALGSGPHNKAAGKSTSPVRHEINSSPAVYALATTTYFPGGTSAGI